MTDFTTIETRPSSTRRYPASQDILMPDGDRLRPRALFAAKLGISEMTLKRMKPKTLYLGNRSFVSERSVMEIIARSLGEAKRRTWINRKGYGQPR